MQDSPYTINQYGESILDEWPYAQKDGECTEDEELIFKIIDEFFDWNQDLSMIFTAVDKNDLLKFAKKILDQFDVEVK